MSNVWKQLQLLPFPTSFGPKTRCTLRQMQSPSLFHFVTSVKFCAFSFGTNRTPAAFPGVSGGHSHEQRTTHQAGLDMGMPLLEPLEHLVEERVLPPEPRGEVVHVGVLRLALKPELCVGPAEESFSRAFSKAALAPVSTHLITCSILCVKNSMKVK
jgi:hypothetical protein